MSSTHRSRRRHCMVVHAYYPLGETRVQREALTLVDHGYDVDVICLRGPADPRRSVVEGVTVRRLPVRRHRRPGNTFLSQFMEYLAFFVLATGVVSALHLRRRYDSVQVHNLPDFLVFSAVVPKLTGALVVLDLHDLMPEFFATRAGVDLHGRLTGPVRWQERLACRFADRVVTVTDGWRETLIDRGVPPGKVSVVMNLADPRVFVRDHAHEGISGATEADATGSEATGEFRVMYHGTFTPRYGVDLILDAVALLRDELPGLRLLLLGDGEAHADLVAQRARLGLEDRVEISSGMADVAGVPRAIEAADVGVVPHRSSVFTDGLLPTKLLEYVAMGKPVIAARTPTVAAYFNDDMLAFFEPGRADDLARALRQLAEDDARRRALAQRAETFNRRYSWPSEAARYAALIAGGDGTHGEKRRVATGLQGPSQRVSDSERNTDVGYRVRTSMAVHDPDWDAFLAGLPGGHHTQTSLWAQVKDSVGWRAARVVAHRDARIVGGAQILYRRISPLAAVGYISRGPVLGVDDPQLGAVLMDAVEQAARSLHIRHLTVQPLQDTDDVPSYLEDRSYLATETEVAPRATVLLDVSRDPADILAAMTSKTRYNVRLSGRRDVKVRDGDRGDLDIYYELLRATGKRQGFEPFPKNYFVRMWDVLAPLGHLRLSLAEHDGQVVSGQIAIAFGDTAVNKLSVWSGQVGNRRPNEALQWSAIQWAHERGCSIYDFEGLKLRAAQAILRGEPLPDSAGQSVTSFKLGFGGTVVVMPPARVFIPNAALRWSFGEVYPRISGARYVKATVKRIRTRPAGGRVVAEAGAAVHVSGGGSP